MTVVDQLVQQFGTDAKDKLGGPGEREALLSGPVARLIEDFGKAKGLKVIAHNEVTELDGAVRPDFGVRVNGALVGHIELKSPGTSLDPASYGKSTHNYKQWLRLKELPNLLYTNGLEWRLWRFGELVDEPVHLHASSLYEAGKKLRAPGRFELILSAFLNWSPPAIVSAGRLVEVLAPLARMMREEVKLALQAERRAIKSGAALDDQPFLGIARDWRALLFPRATDAEFADGYAQTVTFAFLLAVSEGLDIGSSSIYEVSKLLEKHHSLMAKSLRLLTEHVSGTPTCIAVELLARILSAVRWDSITATNHDVYLHLYEHFLAVYDPDLRKMSGSYYTPIEIVDSMVALTESVLKNKFGKAEGLRHPEVSIVDPAMGTGTYPISILRRVAEQAARQYGPGAAPEAVANATSRIFGLELQSGPFSVAEMRISNAIQEAGADLPSQGLNLYVADTLEDPNSASSAQLSYTLQLIAKQRQLANKMKRERNIQVCIGNPPYKDHAGGKGGWIESGTDEATGRPPLASFKIPGNGIHERHLSNLYVYFWRWAFWKVFESTNQPEVRNGGNGIVAFITATGYLSGPGFKGMRQYIRRNCSHGWIIDLTPEGKQPPARNAVFDIETPVAIGIFARTSENQEDKPADIKYISLHGTREEKFATLKELSLDDASWRDVRSEWTAPLRPAPSENSDWDSFPATSDLLPWVANGIMAGRGWIYAPSKDILEARLRNVVSEDNEKTKSNLFYEGRDANLTRTKKPLPGSDTEQDTRKPFRSVKFAVDPKIVRVGYRSFDRQWVIADSRLMSQPSPDLWLGRIPGQIFCVELHSEYPKAGPGLAFSALIPDVHFFRGSGGGRAIPLLHPDGSPNVSVGFVEAMNRICGWSPRPTDLVPYMAGLVAHPSYVQRFEDELKTPGVRVPITRNKKLWDRLVDIGNNVIWLHTFGQGGRHPSLPVGASILDASEVDQPRHEASVGKIPDSWEYIPETETLRVGAGRWSRVKPHAMQYRVGGTLVVESWLDYRKAKPKGRRTSPLDSINSTEWPASWSIELSEVISAVTQLAKLEPEQESLLDEVVSEPTVSLEELIGAGVKVPLTKKDRKPLKPIAGGLYGTANE